jgi:UDPglucose 6-dehydrogenase
MKICVHGLWHLGAVTAACLAEAGFTVAGLDAGVETVANLSRGVPPLFEPGLQDLTRRGLESGRLTFTTVPKTAVSDADVIWVAFDTPVDDEDQADPGFVMGQVQALFPWLKPGAIILISSQLPVGSTAELERRLAASRPGSKVTFAYSPENLRLGKAIEVFTHSERIVIGVRDAPTREAIGPLLQRFCPNLIWTSVESAEMVKHALNAFLATCVTFTNEVANLCEWVGADAMEVERALRSEPRVGPKAYVHAGAAFAGGTLARDVVFLGQLARAHHLSVPLLESIIPSNGEHRRWVMRQLQVQLGNLPGKTVAVLGLAYKPGTDAIRRSAAIELCRWLAAEKVSVQAYDPQVRTLPSDLAAAVRLTGSVADALQGSDAVVIATEWPEFRETPADLIVRQMRRALVIDQNRFLPPRVTSHADIRYITIGKPA